MAISEFQALGIAGCKQPIRVIQEVMQVSMEQLSNAIWKAADFIS